MSVAMERSAPAGVFAPVAAVAAALVLGIAVVGFGLKALAGLIGLLFFAFFLVYPVLGLYATTALLMLQGSGGVLGIIDTQAPFALTLAQIAGVAALAAWGAHLLTRKLRIEWDTPTTLIVLFVVWALFGTVVGPYGDTTLPHWVRLAARLGFFLLAINTLNTRRNITYFVGVVLACSLIMAGIAAGQYFFPSQQTGALTALSGMTDAAFIDTESLQGEAAVRVSGRAGHSNWLALIILIVMPFNAFWWQLAKGKAHKTLVAAAVAAEIAALILTFTRTGLLIGGVIFLLFLVRGQMRINPLRVFAALFALVIVWTLLPDPYKERVLKIEQYTQSESVRARLDLQNAAARFTLENPLFGYGVGGFGERFVEEGGRTAETMEIMVEHAGWQAIFIGTHNLYLQLSADTGLAGLALFIAFFWVLVKRLFALDAEYRRNGDALGKTLVDVTLIATVGFLFCGLFLHALHQEIWWMLAALAVALTHFKPDFRGPLPKWSWSTEARLA